MSPDRRRFLAGVAAMAVAGHRVPGVQERRSTMYGLIGSFHAMEGRRDELAAVLVEGARNMPGCRSYVVAVDPSDEVTLWVTEVWDSEEAHRSSLALPSIQEAIARGRPLIAGFGERVVTRPVGGHGLG